VGESGKVSLKPRCPRCGYEISWIERIRRGDRVYYLAVHYLGYSGKKKKVRKCYLGPEEYVYVSRTHQDLGIVFEGAIDDRRIINYLHTFIKALTKIELEKPILIEILNILKHLVSRLEEYVAKIEEEETTQRS
jgi:hypothetical protein